MLSVMRVCMQGWTFSALSARLRESVKNTNGTCGGPGVAVLGWHLQGVEQRQSSSHHAVDKEPEVRCPSIDCVLLTRQDHVNLSELSLFSPARLRWKHATMSGAQ